MRGIDKYISHVLAEQVLSLMEQSGANKCELYVALEIAKALIPIMDVEETQQAEALPEQV